MFFYGIYKCDCYQNTNYPKHQTKQKGFSSIDCSILDRPDDTVSLSNAMTIRLDVDNSEDIPIITSLIRQEEGKCKAETSSQSVLFISMLNNNFCIW